MSSEQTERELSISRSELQTIIESAASKCGERGREKLRRVAATTSALAVGWFHTDDGVYCPARQAHYQHTGFQQAFDDAMAARLGIEWDVCNPVAVKVTD